MTDLDHDIEELDGLRRVLKPAQERMLAEMAARPDEPFARADYEATAHVSRSQAAYDLADLVKLGLVERLGSGRATRYRIARTGAGRRRKWTPERIRAELEELCDELGGWPRAAEFKDAGRGDLYLAASRYGGIGNWAEELGYSEQDAPQPREAEPGEPLRKGALAGAGLAALGALALLVGLNLAGGDRPAEDRRLAAAPLRESPDATGGATVDRTGTQERQEPELRLAAPRGDSWLVVRRESADGRLLWKGLLERGESLSFRGRLWLRLGDPDPLVARLNGDRESLPPRTSTARVTEDGIRVLTRARRTVLAAAGTETSEDGGSIAPSVPVSQPSSPASTPQSSSPPSPSPDPAPDPAPAPNSGPSPDPPPGD